jgi:putative tricarboxylic transport membrane protein
MGLFGISEILTIAVQKYVQPAVAKVRLRELYPNKAEMRRSLAPIARGSVLGFFVGLLPGPSTVISTFVAYALEKRISRRPEEFGQGAVEGVVAPEAANNSAVMGSMIPLLTLGIPFAAPSAIMLAGLRMHNVEPGPMMFTTHPDVFWTFIAAMYLGNLMLLVLNLPLVGLWVRLTRVPYGILGPVVLLLCFLGAYSVRNNLFDVGVSVVLGIAGYVLRKYHWPLAPMVLSFMLGPLLEKNLIQALSMSGGSPLIFDQRGLAVALLLTAGALLIVSLWLMQTTVKRVEQATAEGAQL